MNLGTWRIAIIVLLVVVGVAVLANGFDDAGTAVAGPSPTLSPSPDTGDGTADGDGTGANESPEPTEPPEETLPEPNESGVLVKVFNGTSAVGLAAEVQDQLVNEGNNVAPEEPANAPASPVARTTVYYRGGPDAAQNEADATYIAETFIRPTVGRKPKVEELSSVFDDIVGNTITVVVLLGEDYVTATADGG